MNIFLSDGLGERCNQTELALNFIKKNILTKTFSLHFGQIATP